MDHPIPKGTFDILPYVEEEEAKWRESARWQYLEETLHKAAHDYGFKEIRTPIFERTELFVRSVGEASDIVAKEMYTFIDRGERSMTLRPEGTAPVIRSFLGERLQMRPCMHKYYYIGPMFRYERPQAGRYRQLHQFGVEALGTGGPAQDVEVIDLACEIYRRLGIQNLTVQINSVGDAASRAAYRDALIQFLTPHQASLSPDNQMRLTKNVLRILDSKDLNDQKILEGAPALKDFLTPDAKEHFDTVLTLLNQLKISFAINPKLVRGLDYYTKTVFEITTESLGAQNAVGGGGRYDGLTQTLGGPHIPSIGFALGMERMLQTMQKQGVSFPKAPHPLVFFVPMGEAALRRCMELACQLRHLGIPADIDLSGKKIQHGLQLADREGSEYVVVLGDEELKTGQLKLKVMSSKESIDCPCDALVSRLQQLAKR